MPRSQHVMTLVAAAALTVLLLGCDRKNVQVLTDTSAAGNAGGGTAGAEMLEAAPGRIEQALRADSLLRAFELEAEKEDNRIVLKGSVRTEQEKARALQIATGQAGGVQIENQIKVEAKR